MKNLTFLQLYQHATTAEAVFQPTELLIWDWLNAKKKLPPPAPPFRGRVDNRFQCR